MVYTKTSIFLFFLIIGTSVFPSGSSPGLAYAKPANSLHTWNELKIYDIIEHFSHLANQQPRNNQDPYVIYGAITNNEGNTYVNKNIRGTVTFDTPSL
ncbi:hypothetical protein ORF504 [Cotesia plutellae polydnavirus]|nr:hypothetical protein ORF504 [Cotesia plutellae polydnavirus]ABR24102.1 hypothetical protein [Cotesia vestalis bracovirus]AEE09531.1 conserved hypothetical protein [Cotesia vestalis bracovirus]